MDLNSEGDQLSELLFFDTFSHETDQDVNLDLVQFPNPIIISEIRIIPLGAKVEADFPGGVRLGATNPSTFSVDFYVNDLKRPSLSSFSYIGRFEYQQNVNIKFTLSEPQPTDGLLIKGHFRTITLGIFGVPTDLKNIIVKESPPIFEQVDHSISFKVNVSESGSPQSSVSTEPGRVKDTIRAKDLEPLLSKLASALAQRNSVKPSTESPPKVGEWPKERQILTSRSSDGNRDEEKLSYHRKRPYLSPVQSPASSPSDTSLRSSNNIKSFKRRDIPASPCSSRSRSPRHTQSRSRSPWHKSQPSDRYSSPRRRSPPTSHLSISSSKVSPHHEPYKWKRRRVSPPLSPIPPSVHKSVASLSNENSYHGFDKIDFQPETILPVNKDLLEEISPEHSIAGSDWENISEDENLDDISSLDGNDGVTSGPADQGSEALESISSEEEYFEVNNVEESDYLSSFNSSEICDYDPIWKFDPYSAEFSPLKSLHDPAETDYCRNQMCPKSEEKSINLISLLADRDSRNQKWIESMEDIAKGIEFLPLTDENRKILFDWLVDALDVDIASKQLLIPSKVRQIKAGIKLVNSLFATHEGHIVKLLELQVSKILTSLIEGQNIPLPLKLLVIRSFDTLCDTVIGIEHLLTVKFTNENHQLNNKSSTYYQYLLKILLKKPSIRLTVAIESLLNKIHFYLFVKKFNTTVKSGNYSVPLISSFLKKIGEEFVSMSHKCTQKPRYLPVSCFFEQKDHRSDCYTSFYNWSNHYDLIESMTSIICNSEITKHLIQDVVDLLKAFFSTESFPRFLLSQKNCSKLTRLFQTLLQEEQLIKEHTGFVIHSLYLLQVYQLIDILQLAISSKEFCPIDSCDDPLLCSTFSKLYFLSRTAIGQDCVIEVLTTAPFFEVILPFLALKNVEKDDDKLAKSVCANYAAELCTLVVQSSNENLLQFYASYGQLLCKVSKETPISSLTSLVSWLSPLDEIKSFDYSEECFKELCLLLKNHADAASKLKENEVFKPSPQVITILRILKHLCLPSRTVEGSASSLHSTELKYNYALMQIFSHDALSSILTLLHKLAETLLRPSHQSPALVGNQGTFVINFITPSILLVKSILKSLIIARGKDFRDISPIPVMLKLYSVMYLFPSSSFSYSASRKIVKEVVDVLMLYTGLILTPTESDPETLSKSIWSKMLKGLLDYTFSLPMTFIHGLSLLSELLPLPLPFQSQTALTEEEETRLISIRKLWSAHLLGLSSDIEKLITSFVFCSSPIIQQLLRRVCVQISDLSSPASTLIVRSVLEALLETFPSTSNNGSLSSLIYVLSLLSFLITHPSFKMAFIHTMHIGGKLDEKYFAIVGRLLALLNPSAAKSIDKQLNALILKFLHSLCDSSIFLNSKSGPPSSLQILSNSLPPYKSIKSIIFTLLKFINSTVVLPEASLATVSSPSSVQDQKFIGDEHSDVKSSIDYFSLISALKVLSLFCKHDYSFLPLKQAVFEDFPDVINTLVLHICKFLDFTPKQDEITELITTLSSFFKLFALPVANRSGKLSRSDLSTLFAWKGDEIHTTTPSTDLNSDDKADPDGHLESGEGSKTSDNNSTSPLLLFHDTLLQKVTESGESHQSFETTKSLIKILETTKDDNDSAASSEIQPPLIEPLPLQFSRRKVYDLTDDIDQEKLNLDYWLSMPTFYAHERYLNLADSNRINFVELSCKYISGESNLRKELQEILNNEDNQIVFIEKTEASVTPAKVEPSATTKDPKSTLSIKKSFVAPLRGRGYSRVGNLIHSSRANDPFRSRPPNTSRPPSMHVDDFVALEQSTNNSYEPSSKRFKPDYASKPRTGSNHNSFTRSFNSSNNSSSRLSPPVSSHHSDLHLLNSSHSHHSSVRNMVNSSGRSTLSRYSRDAYSPTTTRAPRSGSTASSSSQQIRAKANSSHSRRESRDPRLNRDVHLLRESSNR